MSPVQAMSAQLIWSSPGPSQKDCLMASTASSILIMSPTRKPPVSRARFQVSPKSLRLIEVRASKESMAAEATPAATSLLQDGFPASSIEEVHGLVVDTQLRV
jgi:hypothetical protein